MDAQRQAAEHRHGDVEARGTHVQSIVEMAVLDADALLAGQYVQKGHNPERTPVGEKVFEHRVVIADDVVDPQPLLRQGGEAARARGQVAR